jgi:hypothetical protein
MGPSLLAGVLTATLLAPAPRWQPAGAPRPTVWARAGATAWAACEELGRQAATVRGGSGPRGDSSADDASAWTERATRCPAVPEVLVLAAQIEIATMVDVSFGPEPGSSLDSVVEDHHERVVQALKWLDAALAESARRREPAPRETRFLRAYALVALGRPRAARDALDDSVAYADVERWRSDRMGAVIALLAGDLDRAMKLAHLAAVSTPPDDRTITRYIRALVLDRGGAPAAARAEMVELRNDVGHIQARHATESLLPVHERLYLRALEHQAGDDPDSAIRLWDAYLARPEPEEPDKVVARRHREALRRKPSPVR